MCAGERAERVAEGGPAGADRPSTAAAASPVWALLLVLALRG